MDPTNHCTYVEDSLQRRGIGPSLSGKSYKLINCSIIWPLFLFSYRHNHCQGRTYSNQKDANLADGDGFFNDRITALRCTIVSTYLPNLLYPSTYLQIDTAWLIVISSLQYMLTAGSLFSHRFAIMYSVRTEFPTGGTPARNDRPEGSTGSRTYHDYLPRKKKEGSCGGCFGLISSFKLGWDPSKWDWDIPIIWYGRNLSYHVCLWAGTYWSPQSTKVQLAPAVVAVWHS